MPAPSLWTRRPVPVRALLLLAAVSGCGDDAEDADDDGAPVDASLDAGSPTQPDAGEGCKTFVSDSLIDHACFHELMGPHAERTAGSNEIDVDRAHTSFHVRLPALPSGRFGGVVTYQSRFTGEHAIFTRDGSIRVRQQNTTVEPAFMHATEICAVLPSVAVYALQQTMYTLEIESDRADVVLVIEYMNEGTVDDAYRVECNSRPRPPRDAATFVLDASSLDAAQGTTDAGTASDGGECRIDPVLEHSCLHALHGPYESATGVTAGTAPDVSKVHTAWRVTLPSTSTGLLNYRPNMMGEYVFYLDRPLPFEVKTAAETLSALYSEPVSGCNGIVEARVYALAKGSRYDLSLGPVAGDYAMLIIESVNALTANDWANRLEACP